MPDRDESNPRRPARPLTAPFRGPSAPRALTPPSSVVGRRAMVPPFAVPPGTATRPPVTEERAESPSIEQRPPEPAKTVAFDYGAEEARPGLAPPGHPTLVAPPEQLPVESDQEASALARTPTPEDPTGSSPQGELGVAHSVNDADLGRKWPSAGSQPPMETDDRSQPLEVFRSLAAEPYEGSPEGDPGVATSHEQTGGVAYDTMPYPAAAELTPDLAASQPSPSAQAWPEELWAYDSGDSTSTGTPARGPAADPFGEWAGVGAGEDPLAGGAQGRPRQDLSDESGSVAPHEVSAFGSASEAAGTTPVAEALELLAARIRSGELTVPGYEPGMSDAAALTAALAAVLGVRR